MWLLFFDFLVDVLKLKLMTMKIVLIAFVHE